MRRCLPGVRLRHFPVRIDAPDVCGRFTARVLRGVKIAPSAGKAAEYFGELGQKQISNAVDATNFVLLGMGHPTHAFDLDKIVGGIVVRRAKASEQIRLLDGSTRTLVAEDLVVADEVKALGLAGVMGGWDSMITETTTNVLVEAAWFSPAAVRASSRRHLIHTDASHRFERGADFAGAPVANALVTKAILEACGGTLEGGLVDVVVAAHEAATAMREPIRLAVSEVKRLLGTTLAPEGITAGLVEQYLTALGCQLAPMGGGAYEVTLPSWRLDLEREIDLIEEVARVYGYNRFANTLPTPAEVIPHATARAEKAVRARLYQAGFSEAISSTFASAAESEFYAPGAAAIALENPLSEEAAKLRPSLLPGMVTMLAHNLNRDVDSARLFELGGEFSGSQAEVLETQALALGMTGAGRWTAPHSADDAPFFELKGAFEAVLSLFEVETITYTADELPAMYEQGRGAVVLCNGEVVGALGQLSSAEAARRKLRQPVYVGEVKLTSLMKCPLRHAMARELSRFQAVQRDFSFVFPEMLQWATIEAAVRGLGIEEMTAVSVEETFRDAKKWPGVFSMLVRVVFQSTERTLVDAELAGWSASIIKALEKLGGTIRG